MGTVYARGRMLWIGFAAPNGKWVYRSSGYEVGQEPKARELLAELETAIAERSKSAPAPLTHTVASWTEAWAQRRVEKGKWTNAELDRRALQRHVAGAVLDVHDDRVLFGRLRLEEVRTVHVRAWLEAMEAKKLAANTVLSVYSLLSRAFTAAVRLELLDVTPCQLERGELPRLAEGEPDGRPEDAMFSLRELEQLISDERIPLDRRVGYAVTCLGGLRQGELAALTWADYDATLKPLGRLYVSKSYTRKNKRVKTTKNQVARWVPVHGAAAALLAEWSLSGWAAMFGRNPKPENLLLPNREGRFLTDLNLWGNLQHDLKKLGWPHRKFHDTRATFCTYATAAGAPWELVKHISHGVKRRSRRMQEVYVRPPWEVLCGIVQGIKLQLRGEAALLPLRAAAGAAGSDSLRSATTEEESMPSKVQHQTANPQVPRARFELAPPRPHDRSARQNSGASSAATGTDAPRSPDDRSESTTARGQLIPFRGGMRIDEG